MQKVFEKITNKLEKRAEEHDFDGNRFAERKYWEDYCAEKNKMQGLNEAIEIVKQEAEKYNNGWIPCSERLPEKNGYYYVTQIVKSISTGKKIAIEKDYVEFSEGKWRRAKHLEVIAWIDIETYQPKVLGSRKE